MGLCSRWLIPAMTGVLVVILLLAFESRGMSRCEEAKPAVTATGPSPEDQASLQQRLMHHVRVLAGDIGERNVFRPQALRQAEAYITEAWREQGYTVTRHEYEVHNQRWANLEVIRRGSHRPEEIILVGAHYDSVLGSPGANDNATGVAALLELSRWMTEQTPSRTVRLVAFVNEEPPFFQSPDMGSRVYARQARERGDDIRAMLSLETIGYYSDAKGSQSYPPLFNLFYPDRGNFIGFVGNRASRPLVQQAAQAFRAYSDFPLECATTFASVPGVDWSDHASFWKYGYPAMMVTDTAPYRYPYYHTAADTPDKIQAPALAQVTEGLAAVLKDQAGGQ